MTRKILMVDIGQPENTGSKVDINLENDHLVLKPTHKKYTLSELLNGMEEGDMPYDKSFENMPTVGKEALLGLIKNNKNLT